MSASVLDAYMDFLQVRPLRLVQLVPRLEVIATRDAGRDKHVFDLWKHLHVDLHERMDRVGLWLDTSEMDVGEAADAIVQRVDDALVTAS